MFNEFKKGFGSALGAIVGVAAGLVGYAYILDKIQKKYPNLFGNEKKEDSSTEENESYN